MSALVSTSIEGGVLCLTLDDARRKNALSVELGDALQGALLAPHGARAIVIHGAGSVFSSGGDLAMLERLRQVSQAEAHSFMLGFYARFLCVREVSVPVFAAVEGVAIGAGLCLALACDGMLVARDARLALNFTKLGLAPGLGATYFAPRAFGHARAFELLATGRTFSGEDALRFGAALDACESGEVLGRTKALAQTVADNAPLALALLKKRCNDDGAVLARVLDEEARGQAVTYASRDLGEGLLAAREKRTPRFVGA